MREINVMNFFTALQQAQKEANKTGKEQIIKIKNYEKKDGEKDCI